MKFLKSIYQKGAPTQHYFVYRCIDIGSLCTHYFLLWNSYAAVGITIEELQLVLPMLLFFNIVAFFYFKTFSGILRFSSFGDLSKIVYALTAGYGVSFIFLQILELSGSSFHFRWEVFF